MPCEPKRQGESLFCGIFPANHASHPKDNLSPALGFDYSIMPQG
jgi:hypothetical protein